MFMMKRLHNRQYLLPLVLTVTVLFAYHGIILPGILSFQKAKQCASVSVKCHDYASQSSFAKTSFVADIINFNDVLKRTTFQIVSINRESHTAVTVLDSAIPPRAPPV